MALNSKLTWICQALLVFIDSCCILGIKCLKKLFDRADIHVGQSHTAVPEREDSILPHRKLYHWEQIRVHRVSSEFRSQSLEEGFFLPLWNSTKVGITFHHLQFHSVQVFFFLPSSAELADPARSSTRRQMISRICTSFASPSSAYISRQRRGPKLPSF